MRKQFFLIAIPGIIIGIILAVIVMAFSKSSASPEAELLQPITTNQKTAADKHIRNAQNNIKQAPENPQGYNMLAAAFMQKARETGDFSFNARAEEAIKHSFRVKPDNYDGLKTQAAVLLNFHRFAEALEMAKKAQVINPNDHEVYGAMVDALVELGKYDEAVDAAQKMVDLRPDTASYSRISYLRSLHGDTKGAAGMMKMAATSASPGNPESIAWTRVHLGDELMNLGKLKEAEHEYDFALFSFPDYHLALAAKAKARFANGDNEEAIRLYKRAIERVPLPDYIAALGDLYAKLGKTDEAKQQYEQVEFIEKNGAVSGTYSRELALFWADHNMNLDRALETAKDERKKRKDIYTSDVLAWTLYKKGNFAEAKAEMDQAMRLGTRDARLYFHAGMIALALDNDEKGKEYLKEALSINPYFDILQAEVAKKKLNELSSN